MRFFEGLEPLNKEQHQRKPKKAPPYMEKRHATWSKTGPPMWGGCDPKNKVIREISPVRDWQSSQVFTTDVPANLKVT